MASVALNHTANDLNALLASIPTVPRGSLGTDIDEANVVLLDPAVTDESKVARFRKWASRFQPCMFGRLGAKGVRGIQYDICWINRAELAKGSASVADRIQRARRAWKQRAAEGCSHGFLIMFNAPELASAQPGSRLIEICVALSNLYLVEHAPVRCDTIYTESVPFNGTDGASQCLKGGINIFYASAHRTSNHDRRVPGGIMISVNSPGLLAHSLVKRGFATDLPGALEAVRALAWASIGNGGLSRGIPGEHSCSWHNADALRPAGQCPMKHRPRHVPENFATDYYSAMYHTDVLVPTAVMMDSTQDPPRGKGQVWSRLDFLYLSAEEAAPDHDSFGFVHGERVAPDLRYEHQWPPAAVLAATEAAGEHSL